MHSFSSKEKTKQFRENCFRDYLHYAILSMFLLLTTDFNSNEKNMTCNAWKSVHMESILQNIKLIWDSHTLAKVSVWTL